MAVESPLPPNPPSVTAAPAREVVLLIHGFAAPNWVMKPLARRLREAGYDVRPWSYPSFRGRLKEHGDALADELTRLTNELEGTKIHIVAHSMGCIVTRAALRKVQSETIGRVVLLAPPNRGSNWAWLLSPIVKYLIPTVYDLSTARTSYVNNLPTPDIWYVGIVRADFDLLVPRFSIELSEQMDFISFPTTHLGLLLRRDVAETVISFLKKGAFPMPSRHDH